MTTRKGPLTIAEISAKEYANDNSWQKLIQRIPQTPFQHLLLLYGACRFARIWVADLTPRQAWDRTDTTGTSYGTQPHDWKYWILTEVFEMSGDKAMEGMYKHWSWELIDHAYTVANDRIDLYETMIYKDIDEMNPADRAERRAVQFAYDVWYQFRNTCLREDWLDMRAHHLREEREKEKAAAATPAVDTPAKTE